MRNVEFNKTSKTSFKGGLGILTVSGATTTFRRPHRKVHSSPPDRSFQKPYKNNSEEEEVKVKNEDINTLGRHLLEEK